MSLDLLLDEIRFEADRQNGTVLGEALKELKNIDTSEVRRRILRTLPPTCRYRVLRRKYRKAQKAFLHVRSWRRDTYMFCHGWECSEGHFTRSEIAAQVESRHDKYKNLIANVEPCDECFSCRTSDYQADRFFREILPRIVSEQVRDAQEEVQLFVTSVLNGEFNG